MTGALSKMHESPCTSMNGRPAAVQSAPGPAGFIARRRWRLIVTDYLQLMTEAKGTTATSNYKRHARAGNCWPGSFTFRCSACRNCPGRLRTAATSVRMLLDLRDSGAIEQDADVVILMFREEYYRDGPKGS